MDYSNKRNEFVKWVRRQLTGPVFKDKYSSDSLPDEILQGISPLERFPTGALYPITRMEEGLDPISEDDDNATESLLSDEIENEVESTAKPRRYVPPSSVGFSFFATGEKIEFEVECSAVRYEQIARDKAGKFISRYKRIELETENVPFTSAGRKFIFEGGDDDYHAGIDVQFREHLGGFIITVSLFNNQELESTLNYKNYHRVRLKKTLFEVSLKTYIHSGQIADYPRVEYELLDEEEQELELQYRHKKIYAVGHGAAANWAIADNNVSEIWADFIPTVEVPQVTADTDETASEVLVINDLASYTKQKVILQPKLEKFIADYDSWIHQQKRNFEQTEAWESEAATRITKRMKIASDRMSRGLKLIRNSEIAARAFELANHAILNQMHQHDKNLGRNKDLSQYKWRPFQLAFILTALESVINEDDEFRDVVDLIWFPTGGGKTEAYLGLIAFLLIWRRLKYRSSGSGTCAIMRYTLRLLTSQQYLRATRMICALELIRRDNPDLGEEPITIGMWVGQATSPNTFEQAHEMVTKAKEKNAKSIPGLIITSCPWCNDKFKPNVNYISTLGYFHFCCRNKNCDFYYNSVGNLPCNVVDEALYSAPPSLLIATIDKFARFTWEERVSSFLGAQNHRPPELIIQDELHLIAGALGSIAGLYEASLDTTLMCSGVYPKYIASTATIRMAKQHVKKLYGRDLAVFPPPGLCSEDSYFAKTVSPEVRPGRLYVGYLAPMLNRQKCMAPLAATLLAAPEGVFADGEIDRENLLEAWWTQVIYHGSIKGVGNSHNSYNIDVREFFERIVTEYERSKNGRSKNESSKKNIQRTSFKIAQLTSLTSAEINAQTFSKLEIPKSIDGCLDTVLATNMISVGLDVGRLALMIINGQPLTTAEYIQASSRVGRSEVPGIVFINYYRDQARSLSHFENFRPYHDSFYRFVEPISITPYTYQARRRALHAAIIISIRHSCRYLLKNNSAGNFNPQDECVKNVLEKLKTRCIKADPERMNEIVEHIDQIVERWYQEAELCRKSKRQLVYVAPGNDRANDRLIHNFDDLIKGLWPTLQSMRNVENTAFLKAL